MALTANWSTRVISVPVSDLTPQSPGVYSLTVTFWWQLLRELAGSNEGIAETVGDRFPFTNTPPQPGTPRIVNLINNYTVLFAGGPYTLNVIDGNTNLSGVRGAPSDGVSLNTNNVSGFNTVNVGSAVTQGDKDDIENQIFSRLVEAGVSFEQVIRLYSAALLGDIVVDVNGGYSIQGLDSTTTRITGTPAPNNGRNVLSRDGQ